MFFFLIKDGFVAHVMVGWLVNSKSEGMWKEAFLVGLLSQLLPKGADVNLLCQGGRSAGPDLKTERRVPW